MIKADKALDITLDVLFFLTGFLFIITSIKGIVGILSIAE